MTMTQKLELWSTDALIDEHARLQTADGTLQPELDQFVEVLRQRGTVEALRYVESVEQE